MTRILALFILVAATLSPLTSAWAGSAQRTLLRRHIAKVEQDKSDSVRETGEFIKNINTFAQITNYPINERVSLGIKPGNKPQMAMNIRF